MSVVSFPQRKCSECKQPLLAAPNSEGQCASCSEICQDCGQSVHRVGDLNDQGICNECSNNNSYNRTLYAVNKK